MATLIPNDPRNRKTFTYQEQNWATEHNRNWTQTVSQLNDVDDIVRGSGGLSSRLTLAENDLEGLDTRLADIEGSSDTFLPETDYKSLLRSRAFCAVSQSASSGDTTLYVTATPGPLEPGDKLYAYVFDSSTKVAIEVDSAATVGLGATSFSVKSLSGAIPEDAPVFLQESFLRESVISLDGSVGSLADRVDINESDITSHTTQITQNADEIRLMAERVHDSENLLSRHATLIRQNADKITLLATEDSYDELEDRLETAEGRIDVAADEVSLLQQTTNNHNDLIQQNTNQIRLNEDGITLLNRSVTETDGRVDDNLAQINLNKGQISQHAQKFVGVDEDISTHTTLINQNADEIKLQASKGEAIDVSGEPAAVTLSQIDNNTVTSIKFQNKAWTWPEDQEVFQTDESGNYIPDGSGGYLTETVKVPAFKKGDQFILIAEGYVDDDGVEHPSRRYSFRLDEDLVDGDDEFKLQSSLAIKCPAESPIFYVPINERGQVNVTSNLVSMSVRQGDVMSSLNVEFDNINVDSQIFRSSNYPGGGLEWDDATIVDKQDEDGDGIAEMVYLQGNATEGWALSNGGDFEASGTLHAGTLPNGTKAVTIGDAGVDLRCDADLFDSQSDQSKITWYDADGSKAVSLGAEKTTALDGEVESTSLYVDADYLFAGDIRADQRMEVRNESTWITLDPDSTDTDLILNASNGTTRASLASENPPVLEMLNNGANSRLTVTVSDDTVHFNNGGEVNFNFDGDITLDSGKTVGGVDLSSGTTVSFTLVTGNDELYTLNFVDGLLTSYEQPTP